MTLAPMLALAGCSGLDLVDAVAPSSGYAVHRGERYGDHPRQSLDIYVPAGGPGTRRAPVVLFFYGGSWRGGAKEAYRFIGAHFARSGHVAAIADYRIFPEVRFPGFVEDCAAATAFLRRSVAGHGGDPERIFLIGHSAGAHMATLLALEPAYLARVGAHPDLIAGVVGISGPYDHDLGTVRWLAEIFPDPASRSAARVTARVRRGAPPMLLASGTADMLVPARNAVALADRLREFGNRVDLRLYDGVSHGDILLAFVPALAGASTLGRDVAAFLAAA